MGYTKSALIGFSWTASLRFTTRVISFLRTLILARVLLPVQFGVYGVAALVLALLEVFTETGVNIILVQSKHDVRKYINSAWVVSIVRGLIISIIIFFSASPISLFFNSKDSVVMLQIISLVPFLKGFINPAIVKFQKELQFHKEFWYRSSIFLIEAGVSIVFALITHQASSLAFGMIAGAASEIVLSFWLVVPRPRLEIQEEYIKIIFHKGKWVTASSIFNYFFRNADNIVVGKILGPASLGLYEMAYAISIIPITEISDVISKVTFPVYSKISDDKKRLKRAFARTMLVITLLSVPFGILLFSFPELIVNFILGDKWLGIISILPVLAIFGVIRGISGFPATLLFALGKQSYVSLITLASLIGLLIPIVPLVSRYGLIGAATSALIGSVFALPFIVYVTRRVFKE